jgi:tetratricopeptide (TPR) repeat protein
MRLLEDDAGFAEAWLEKAFCHWEAGQLVPAVESALRAVVATPRCIRANHNLHPHAEAALPIAYCLEVAHLPTEASKAYKKSLALEEHQPFARVRLGQLFWRQGLVGEAMKEFTKGMPYGYRLANIPGLPRQL